VPLEIESRFLGDCPNCGGLGYVFVFEKSRDAKPMRYPPSEISKYFEVGSINCNDKFSGWYAGKTLQGDCPACRKGTIRAWLERRCGLIGSELLVSLEGFNVDGQLADKKPARDYVAKLLSMNFDAHGFATFWGGYGCGKTHLLKSIVNGLRGVGLWSSYISLNGLLSDIRSRFGEPNGQREVASIIEYYRSIRVLCLDEIDKANLTSWANETIFGLVDDRYNRIDSLLTVFASNKAPTELPAELGYMASRFTQGDIIQVPGPDMRPVKHELEDWTDK
jgi:DNA replication protein DnaC